MKTNRLLIVLLCMTLLLSACVQVPTEGLTERQQTAIAATVTAVIENENAQKTPEINETAEPTSTARAIPEATETTVPTSKPASKDVIGPNEYPEGVNPLTGLAVENPLLLQRRPVIMKISNHQIDYQPHWGLSSADLVFEYYIGWGANRYAALFYGLDSNKIGPIRSIRRVDGHLGSLYQGVVGSTGGDKDTVLDYVDQYIPGRYYIDKDLCPGVCDDGRWYVYSVFGNSAGLSNYFNAIGYGLENPDLRGMTFSETAPEGGEAGQSVWVIWTESGKAQWIYNEESGKYHNWTIDESTYFNYQPLIDQNTGEQLAFSNVIVLKAPYTEIQGTLHQIDLIGNTTGYEATIFRDGKAYEVFWKTPEKNKPIQFFNADGSPFHLKPGNSWITLFGLTSPTTIDGDEWSITFNMP